MPRQRRTTKALTTAALILLMCVAASACGTARQEATSYRTPEPLSLATRETLDNLSPEETAPTDGSALQTHAPTPNAPAGTPTSYPTRQAPREPTTTISENGDTGSENTVGGKEPQGSEPATEKDTTKTPEHDAAAEPGTQTAHTSSLAAYSAEDRACLPAQVVDDETLRSFYDALDETGLLGVVGCMSPAGRMEALKGALWDDEIPPETSECVVDGLAPLMEAEQSDDGEVGQGQFAELMVAAIFVGAYCAGPELLGAIENLSDEEMQDIKAIACVVDRKGGTSPFTAWLMAHGLEVAGGELENLMTECRSAG